ncbi:hypothetical protein [Clostridium cibarium]|uniref:Uncharacterized protein n=2 Tax=Clostridium TaxID=1485 RepID=A0ABR8PWI8_9CLOT|nr:hypothetical protein [Clostridium cibarium]MBD7912502.1 hypothetical protein [Clostridium cibarium]
MGILSRLFKKKETVTAYVKYFLYECGISKPEKYHKQMINEGYLAVSTIEAIVQALKVDTLKKFLKKLNLH